MPQRLILIALVALSMNGQASVLPPGTYPFRTYGVESGLENLSAVRIAQDSAGFLWVATQEGLYRYDGNRFRRFGLEQGLPSTFISALSAASNGDLWVGTAAGVVHSAGDGFRLVESLPRATANSIAIDARGRVWVATEQGLFTGSGQRFTRVADWNDRAAAVWCDAKRGDVWTASTGLIARLSRGQWTRWELTPRERIDGIVIDARDRLWARSGNHLWSMALDGSDLRDETAALPATSNNGYLSLDARGDLWVPTDRGIAVHNGSQWRIIGPDEGLPTDWARDVFEDREGSIWVASLGVHRMLGRGELVSYKRGDGLPSEVTWCFHWDRHGRLLVGTDLGLARSSENGWSVVAGTDRTQVRSLIEEENGVLWAAGSPAEILRIDGPNVRRFGEVDGVRARVICKLMRSSDGAIWAATRGGGLLRKAPNEDHFARAEIIGGTAEEDFRDVRQDRAGRIWATGQRGLAQLVNGRWKRFTKKDGLRHDHVAYVTETAAGDLLVPYFEPLGMARIRVAGEDIRVIEHLDTATGLIGNKIYLVGEDDRGRLWVGGGTGVDIVHRGAVEHLSTIDGLAGDDTDAMAFLCDERGHVFIGTSSGFSHYVPRSDAVTRAPPAVTVTSATLGRAAVRTNGRNEFSAQWQERDFTATFSALSFFKPDIVEYEVRLDGLDPTWQRVAEPRAHWSRLPHGDYRFEVRARLRPGTWSAPVGMSFEILPAWWQTKWARGAALALLAFLAWLVYRGRVSMLRRRNIELQALVEQRTRELAQANASLLDLSVTDALTGMKNRRYLQFCMPEFTSETLRRHETLGRSGVDPTRANSDLVCLLIDLDHFKEVNDRYGHRAGDQILVSLAELLTTLLRESDTLVRWGGEEFLFLARGASRHEASTIAERIRAAVEEHEFSVNGEAIIRLTCSIGFAAYPFLSREPRRVSWEEVVDITDLCLYAAKRAGRNCWVGVFARHSSAPHMLVRRLRESLDDVAMSGEVEMVTSRTIRDGQSPLHSAALR